MGTNGMLGNWTCGLEIINACYMMKGTCQASSQPSGYGESPIDLGIVPWEVISPQVDKNGIGVYHPNFCTCRKFDPSFLG